MSNIKLHLGDCLEIMKDIPDGSVDAVITDPPYGLNVDYESYDDTVENLQAIINGLIPHVRKYKRGVIFCGITQVHLYPKPDWIGSITWNTTGSYGKFGISQWQPILLYGKDIDGFGSVNGGVLKSDTIHISGGGDVGFQRGKIEKEHPCPKGVKLMRRVITRYTNPGDTILDPFMGSGTTGVACVQTGRNFIGIEIEPKYYEIAEKRIEEAQMQLRLEI
jgi:site-specific DNA-methyltransferase (adenine-specific)